MGLFGLSRFLPTSSAVQCSTSRVSRGAKAQVYEV